MRKLLLYTAVLLVGACGDGGGFAPPPKLGRYQFKVPVPKFRI